MREFRNFTPTKMEEKREESPKTNETTQNLSEDDVQKMFDDRRGKSEDELMSELMSSVNKAKAEGKFNPAELERFQKTVTPFLNEEQKTKLTEILGILS